MSQPNPTVRTCAYCDEPPVRDWPHYPLCTVHQGKATEQDKLTNACAVAESTEDVKALETAADEADRGTRETEFNFPAEIIMQLDSAIFTAPSAHPIRVAAEESMMQIAFWNAGVNPPCSFIMAAYKGGWRYRIDKGFHKEGA